MVETQHIRKNVYNIQGWCVFCCLFIILAGFDLGYSFVLPTTTMATTTTITNNERDKNEISNFTVRPTISGYNCRQYPKTTTFTKRQNDGTSRITLQATSSRRQFCWTSFQHAITMTSLVTATVVSIPKEHALAVEDKESSSSSSTPSSSLLPPPSSNSSSNNSIIKRPSAPLEYLLPAARVKLSIDRAVELVSISPSLTASSSPSLSSSAANTNAKTTTTTDTDTTSSSSSPPPTDAAILDTLRSILLVRRPNYYLRDQPLTPIPQRPAKEYLDTYQRNRQRLSILEQPGAIMVQSGEIMAWKRLKERERRQEEQDEIRAALNIYTSALNYRSDEYVLNVSPKERSQMIRQDALPDIKQVIQSDMGLRYLYRNELLTAIQDARAELEYQLSLSNGNDNNNKNNNASMADLLQVLTKAQMACNQWFSLIDSADVQEAMSVVEREEKAF